MVNHLNELRSRAKPLDYYDRKAKFVKVMRILTTIVLLLVNGYGMVIELPTEFLMAMIPLNAMVTYCIWFTGEKNETTSS